MRSGEIEFCLFHPDSDELLESVVVEYSEDRSIESVWIAGEYFKSTEVRELVRKMVGAKRLESIIAKDQERRAYADVV